MFGGHARTAPTVSCVNDSASPASLASAVGAVLVLPLVAAVIVPPVLAAVDPWASGRWWWGLAFVGVGAVVVSWTVVEFFTVGRGTLAPWDPPRQLVTVGLFAWCRNPMYLGVFTTVSGFAAAFRSWLVALYLVVLAVGFHVRVVRFEERWAERSFPDEWPGYAAHVPRWLPRPPSRPSS